MILAVDVGTSSLKAVLYDGRGRVVAASSRVYATPQAGCLPSRDSKGQAAARGAEADPEQWWLALVQALADLIEEGRDLGSVKALSFTGQMHTAVLLDREGRVIPPTILWLDRRAQRETEELQQELRLPPYQLNSTYTLPKLLWLRRHQPDVLDRVDKVLWPKDYLRFRLTGEACTDLTEPGGAALLDWDSRTWALDRLRRVGLAAGVLPPIRPAHANGGRILPDVARSLGINPDAQVVVGMGDVAALFGGAPPRRGRAVCSLGSSSMIFLPLDEGQPVSDPSGGVYVYPFGPYPMLGGVTSTTGSSLVWVCEQFAPRSFDECVAGALQVEPGVAGLCFLPYLAGERSPHWSDDIRGGFYGLQLSHDARHLVRAVMEGVAYSLRHLLDLCAVAGQAADEIALAAGGAATPGWPQILADVCQRDVCIYAGKETVTRVLYALCQQHLGHGDLASSLSQTFDEPQMVHPDRGLAGVYDWGYRRYREFVAFARVQAGLVPENDRSGL